ncbi:HEXXH motif domain-containing protein [Sphaerisporangium corydalis]|uniref:HEXXH motif domain-containing protein n=1 Tax=Sphaerisporangium corydalis TaxID=1441875 RepID=A0ABV9EKZ4_9ACTN|nr:HEXXH motif domain-containing protein [Sphaerisporangium corydalis]
MNLSHHAVPEDLFLAMASGGGGAVAARWLSRAQHSKHVLLVRGVVDAALLAGHEDAAGARRAYDLLAAVQRHDPAAVSTVLRHPSVGAWALTTLRTLHRTPHPEPTSPGASVRRDAAAGATVPGAVVPGVSGSGAAADGVTMPEVFGPRHLAVVAAAAALRSGADFAAEVPVVDGGVMLPSLGRADLAAATGTAEVRSEGGRAEITAGGSAVRVPADRERDAPGWQGLRRLSATAGGRTVSVLVDDLDPHRMPGARLARGRLRDREAGAWQDTLGEAWRLLVTHHWTTAAEVAVITRVVTPLERAPGDQISGSSRETFGCVAMSAPVDARTLALTLAHEIQHAKLAALLDVVPLIHHDDGRRHYAPWRDDPRPVGGLLQGAYAYLGVTGFWRRQRRLEAGDAVIGANAEFSRWREAAENVAHLLLDGGCLTRRGERFVARMAAVLGAWGTESVPPAAAARARHDALDHLTRWHATNNRDLTPTLDQ